MTVDLIQLAFYSAFTLLGWWLSKRGLIAPVAPNNPAPLPSSPPSPLHLDQQTLVSLLKALLDRMAQPSTGGAPVASSNTFHVPIEVSASPKQPVQSNPP